MSAIQDDSLGLLIADIARLMRVEFAKALTDSPLTFAEARALIYVARFEGARQVELAEYAELQPMTMARLIDTLVSHQLVERRTDPADRRAFRIYLCEAAGLEIAKIKACGLRLQHQVLQGIDEQQIKAQLALLRRNLQQLAE